MSSLLINTGAVHSGAESYRVRLDATASSLSDPDTSRQVPAWIPASQRYYWTSRWQRDELESLRELERGEGRRFGNPLDAIRWLLSDDDG